MTIDNNDIDLSLWEPLPDIPGTSANNDSSFRGYALASVRDTIYISGGNTNTVQKSLLSYDMTTRKWTSLPDMICHRWGHRLAVLEGGQYLFAIGGWGYTSNANGDIGTSSGASSRRKSIFSKSASNSTELGEKNQIEKLASYEIYDVSKKQWKVGGKLNEPRRDFAMSVDSTTGKIYIFGGVGSTGALSSVELYDPHLHMWRTLSPMPQPRSQLCHALHIGNLIYVFEAGIPTFTYNTTLDAWFEDAHDLDEAGVPHCPNTGSVCMSTPSCTDGQVIVYRYVVTEMDGMLANRWMVVHVSKKRGRSWTVLPPVDEFMYYRAAMANGKLVVASGNSILAFQVVDYDLEDDSSTFGHSAAGSTVGTTSTLDESTRSHASEGSEMIKEGTWKRQPEIFSKPPDFRGYAVVSAGDNLYISGGFSGDSTIYNSFLSYNVKRKKWKQLSNMTHHRLGHRMAVSGDGSHVYVLGGGDGKSLRSLGIDIYDVKKKTWSSGPAMNSYRVFFGVTVCLGRLLVFGGVGSRDGNEVGLVEFYDPEMNCWKYAKPMPEARGVCNVISIGHIIYVFGTSSQKVLAYDVIAGEWLEDVPPGVLPVIPPGGCVCASSSHDGGEVLVVKYPPSESPRKQRRIAHVYNESKKAWSSVHLSDDFACYSAAVANDRCVVVTPQNQLMTCIVPKTSQPIETAQ